MAMLAEKKHKQKWSLNPRGKEWSEDANKFGQKMLEKMGWKSGKGLGAKLDGMTEHVKVSHKHDSKGMGYKENGEQWTQHDENFTKLLESLGGESSHLEDGKETPKSLEEISANSKKRVHYRKFTKGKDLTQYSEKQLANIFGKKTLKPDDKVKEVIVQDYKKEVRKFGVDTVPAGSMVDYFKNKLGGKFALSGTNNGFEIGNNGVLKKIESKNEITECEESESELERPSFGFGLQISANNESFAREIDNHVRIKKRKLNKENQEETYVNAVFNASHEVSQQENVEENPYEIKAKRKKIKTNFNTDNSDVRTDTKEKKMKLKKLKTNGTIHGNQGDIEQNLEEAYDNAVFNDSVNDSLVISRGNPSEVKPQKKKNSADISDVQTAKKLKKNSSKKYYAESTNVSEIKESYDNAVFNDSTNESREISQENPYEIKLKNKTNNADSTTEITDVQSDVKKKKDKLKKSKTNDTSHSNKGDIEESHEEAYDNAVFNDSLNKSQEISPENSYDLKMRKKKNKADSSADISDVQSDKKLKKKKSKNAYFESTNDSELKEEVYDNAVFNDSINASREISQENVEENPYEVKPKKKKNKKSDIDRVENSIISNNITEEVEANIKKKKSNKVAPINCEELSNICDGAKIKKKKSKKIRENDENSSIGTIADLVTTLASDIQKTPSKKCKKSKQEKSVFEISEDVSPKKKSKKNLPSGLKNPNVELSCSGITNDEVSSEFEVERKKKKDRKNKKLRESKGLVNPGLNVSNMSDLAEDLDKSYQEGLSTSMQQNLFQGIENLGLNVSADDSTGVCNYDVIECDLILNVAGLPHSAQKKQIERRKSVRFSGVNQEFIIPSNYENKLMAQKVAGLANEGFDERLATMEENMVDIEQQLSTDCAKVENDLNEVRDAAHARLFVPIVHTDTGNRNIYHGNAGVKSLPTKAGGQLNKEAIIRANDEGQVQAVEPFPEVGELDSSLTNQMTPDGDVRLSYKLASLKLSNVAPHLRKLPSTTDRASYKHLIKGDIILGFRKSNLHKIVGYGVYEKNSDNEENAYIEN